MNVAKLPTLFPAISFKRYEPGSIQKSHRWIVRSFHLTIVATMTRLPGDAPPRNDPRVDRTIFAPNSKRSPQACRGSALSEDVSFISYSDRHPSAGRITTSATPVGIIP